MSDSEVTDERKIYRRQDFTPGNYKEWFKRAELQDDPYAEFFMLFIAAITSQEPGNNEFEKLTLLSDVVEPTYRDDPLGEEIIDALNGIRSYIKEHRNETEIQNLSSNPSVRTRARFKSETSFNSNENRLTNALQSILIVRNNLFHGDKRAFGQNDIEIVKLCNEILRSVLKLMINNKT